jgi:hypothetical protein
MPRPPPSSLPTCGSADRPPAPPVPTPPTPPSPAPLPIRESPPFIRLRPPTPSHPLFAPRRDPNAHGGAGPSKAAEAELAYLEAPDREGAKKERTEEDVAHLAQIAESITAQEERNAALARELQVVAAEAVELRKQGDSIKRLFTALGVERGDFTWGPGGPPADEATRKKRAVEIGQRLIKNMIHEAPKAAAAAPARRGRPPLNPPPAAAPAPLIPGAPRPVFTPPASCPLESQIAAGALILSKGDPAVALTALLEKALAPHTAARAAAAAAAAAGDAPPASQAIEAAQ